jgi:hypothetical protein
MRREPTIVGTPIPGLTAVDAVTSEDDWVVEGVHLGKPFKRYVTPNVNRDGAIAHVASVLRLTRNGLEWVTARRRNEVEDCIRLQDNWLRSRTI